jgi:hypothetical protein
LKEEYMDTFQMVRNSLPQPEPLPREPQEYTNKVEEMRRAFGALAAVFRHVEYDVKAGVPTEGPSAGFKTIEGTVYLSWGDDVPGSFTVRAYLDADGDAIPIINGVRQAMGRVFSFCVERAEQPHNDYMRRLLAAIIELRTLMDQLQAGHHLELMFNPDVSGANIHIMCWIDGEQHEDLHTYQNDQNLQAARANLLSFVGGRIGSMLDEENAKRETPSTNTEQAAHTTAPPIAASVS